MFAIVDTGPLVAWFDRGERHHDWVVARIRELRPPLLVCEPVLAEATCLLGGLPKAQDALLALVEAGALRISFRFEEHVSVLRGLLRKYRNVPMSLADACIVCMTELHQSHCVLTFDSDFLVWRKHNRSPLAILHPHTTP